MARLGVQVSILGYRSLDQLLLTHDDLGHAVRSSGPSSARSVRIVGLPERCQVLVSSYA